MQLILLLNVSDVSSKRIGPSSDSLFPAQHDAAKLPCSTTTIRVNTSQSGEFKNLITSGERNLLYTRVEIDQFNLKRGNLSSQSSFDFIIIDENGQFLLSLPRNYDVITFGLLRRRIGIVDLVISLDTLNCTNEEFHFFIRESLWNFIQKLNPSKKYRLCHRVFPTNENHIAFTKYFFITPTWKGYSVECYGMDSHNTTLTKNVREGTFVFVVYWTAYIMIVFSPVLVLFLASLLDTQNDRFKVYKTGDVPYSIKRGWIYLSKQLDCLVPSLGATDRSLQKVCFVVWLLNLVFYCLNIWCHVTNKSVELEIENVEIWSGSHVSTEILLLIFVLLYTIAFVVFIVLTRQCSSELEISGKIKTPMVYFFNPTERLANSCLSKKGLQSFVSFVDEGALELRGIGRQLLWIQMERFFLIINKKFWCFLFKNSFHILVRLKHSGPCIFIALGFPCLLYALLCFILSVFVNLLWGLFPIVGFLFTSLASVNNVRSLIKVIVVSILLHFFIQIVFGENLVFSINVVLITSLIGVPEARSETLPFLSQVVPIVVYSVRYWGQFTKKYTELLNIILEIKKEEKDQQNGDESTYSKMQEKEKEEEEEEEMTILTKDFDILCEYVIPIKEQSIRLFGKIIGALLFLVTAITMLFWKKSLDYTSIDQVVMFVFVFLLPKVVEYFCKGPTESQISDLKPRVRKVWRRLQNGDIAESNKERGSRMTSVICLWKSCCSEKPEAGDRESESKAIPVSNQCV